MSFRFYFSGVASRFEAKCFVAAGVDHVLVDPIDLRNVDGFGNVVLDSGAYRAWKGGKQVDLDAYTRLGRDARFAWHIAPDVIGDPLETRRRWLAHRQQRMVPVWQWSGDETLLMQYLDEAPLVAVGGLVMLMREKSEAMFKGLSALCERHPGRLHLLGANWMRVINELRHCAASMDSSKVMDTCRYGLAFDLHARSRKLIVAPARVLKREHLDREQRLIEGARVMNGYLNGTRKTSDAAPEAQSALVPNGQASQPAQAPARHSAGGAPVIHRSCG